MQMLQCLTIYIMTLGYVVLSQLGLTNCWTISADAWSVTAIRSCWTCSADAAITAAQLLEWARGCIEMLTCCPKLKVVFRILYLV